MTKEQEQLREALYKQVKDATMLTPRSEFTIAEFDGQTFPRANISMDRPGEAPMIGYLTLCNSFPIPQPGQDILYPNGDRPIAAPGHDPVAEEIRLGVKMCIDGMKSFLDDMLAHLDRVAQAKGGNEVAVGGTEGGES